MKTNKENKTCQANALDLQQYVTITIVKNVHWGLNSYSDIPYDLRTIGLSGSTLIKNLVITNSLLCIMSSSLDGFWLYC